MYCHTSPDCACSAPAGSVNTGPFDANNWKYGPDFTKPAGSSPIWNPVMAKMKAGQKVTGGTLFAATDPSTYCAMANAGYDFIWTEMQHNFKDWDQVGVMWGSCPHAKAVPGVRLAYADEREIQHATDAGALVIVVPTVDTVEEAKAARDWTYFPPLGKRSQGGGNAFGNEFRHRTATKGRLEGKFVDVDFEFRRQQRGQFIEVLVQVAVVVERIDQQRHQFPVAFGQIDVRQLRHQIGAQRLFFGGEL